MMKRMISCEGTKRLRRGLIGCLVAMVVTSASAFAVQGAQLAKDGTYTGEGDGTKPKHHTKATIVIENGVIKDLVNVEGKHAEKYAADTEKFKTSIVGQKATYENIDAVSSATTEKYVYSLKNAVLNALKDAPEAAAVKPEEPKKTEKPGKVEKKGNKNKDVKQTDKDIKKNVKSPKTADESNLFLAGGAMILAGIGVATARRKEK